MRNNTIAVATIAFLALSGAAVAQGAIGGAAEGSREGDRAAGPVGAVVGGAAGAVVGGINGLLGDNQRPRFRDYATHRNHKSYAYDRQVDVGAVLPDDGVTYYEVPPEYEVPVYKYAIVNDRTVLVDPHSHRIVQIID
ncbi:hypothetical protein CCR94_17365 [Rhodoblastus sphagnicola]|uniref:DUF1236 domain-containing protein n=1 Tax=Rhodoblastus sphagnicola TaxID=333368 RepID=A0A2S6N1Z0_9HYPH|nr:DUF1236 domain-containing protein [Rhodoblastus sphagnicola]MBB4198261.1 hypothetical protein [Rhodoblastus sphagnicola]PPQ28610.1 hypothetical protein CCR94_17365 [Rhodoblastus sphagnicola]